jgi:two-component system uhpT operon response regulator UhpA
MHVGRLYVTDALALGAHAYVTKGAAPQELIAAIREVMAGHSYLSEDIASFSRKQINDPIAQVSIRERDVLRLLAAGKTPKQAAAELGIAAKTLYIHRASILRKLRLRSDAELTAYAKDRGSL